MDKRIIDRQRQAMQEALNQLPENYEFMRSLKGSDPAQNPAKIKKLADEITRLKFELTAAKAESVQAIANKLCGELPEGWMVELVMENGAGWVEAIKPSGFAIDLGNSDMTINEQLEEALRVSLTRDLKATKGAE